VTGDDTVRSRRRQQYSPRDNCVFELGLFTGALGRQGTLIVKRKGDELRIPSDLLEVTALECTTGKPITLNTRIAPVCHAVRKRVAELGPK
jgi:CRP/FNR family cyclic AMP-dependent transcriptional regulator